MHFKTVYIQEPGQHKVFIGIRFSPQLYLVNFVYIIGEDHNNYTHTLTK